MQGGFCEASHFWFQVPLFSFLRLHLHSLRYRQVQWAALATGDLSFVCLFFAIFTGVEAYFVARRHRLDPLKRYQRWWFYLIVLMGAGLWGEFVNRRVVLSILESFVVPTDSMSPTILAGDQILVDKWRFEPDDLQRNDIVVYRTEGPAPFFVMRVIGLPGDQIEIKDEKVIINGELWPDPHGFFDTDSPNRLAPTNFGPIEIPLDSFFVLGDNRRLSEDSRVIGPISLSNLLGKACVIGWSRKRRFLDPLDKSKFKTGPKRWSRIGLQLK